VSGHLVTILRLSIRFWLLFLILYFWATHTGAPLSSCLSLLSASWESVGRSARAGFLVEDSTYGCAGDFQKQSNNPVHCHSPMQVLEGFCQGANFVFETLATHHPITK